MPYIVWARGAAVLVPGAQVIQCDPSTFPVSSSSGPAKFCTRDVFPYELLISTGGGPYLPVLSGTANAETLSGAFINPTVTGSSLAGVGTLTAGVWNATPITDGNVEDTLTSSKFVGTGSTSDAIDLGTTEVSGILSVANIQNPLNQSTTGNASTATALAVNPTPCPAGQFGIDTDAQATLTCAAPPDANAETLLGTFLNPTIVGITDASVSNTLTSSLFVGTGSTSNAIDLPTTEVAGILSVPNGGTGVATIPLGGIVLGNGTSPVTTLVNTVVGDCLKGTGPTTLPVYGSCVPAASYFFAMSSAHQTGVTSTSTKVIFDSALSVSAGTDISMTASTFTLAAGKTYKLLGSLPVALPGVNMNFRWYNATTLTYFGNAGKSSNFPEGETSLINAIITPAVNTQVELRPSAIFSGSTINETGTNLNLTANAFIEVIAGPFNSSGGITALTGAVTGAGTGSVEASLGSFTAAQLNTAISDDDAFMLGGVQSVTGSKTFLSMPLFNTLTPGRVPFVTTGGALLDEADLTWDSTNNRLGIGISGNNQILSLNNATADNAINFFTNGTSRAFVGVSNNTGGLVTGSAVGDLIFRTQGTNVRWSIDSGSTESLRLNALGLLTVTSLPTSGGGTATFNATHTNGVYTTWTNTGSAIGDVGSTLQVNASGLSTDFAIGARSGKALVLGANGTEKVRITTAGLVIPPSDNSGALGSASNTWASANITTVSSADYFFANGFALTEICRADATQEWHEGLECQVPAYNGQSGIGLVAPHADFAHVGSGTDGRPLRRILSVLGAN